MQLLLLGFFVLLSIALATVLGQNLSADGSWLIAVFNLFRTEQIAIALTMGILLMALIAAIFCVLDSRQRRLPIVALTRQLNRDESPRQTWRLHHLREWSHEEINEVFTRATGARDSAGV